MKMLSGNVNKLLASALRCPANRVDAIRSVAGAQPAVHTIPLAGAAGARELVIGDGLPYLQLGPRGTLLQPFHHTFVPHDLHLAGATVDFGLAGFHLKSQGEQGTGDTPAENPRNDVPPVDPETHEKNPEVPASPDKTAQDVDKGDYSSSGTHPGVKKDESFKPDMDNAKHDATKQQASSRGSGDAGSVTFQDSHSDTRAASQAEMREYARDSDASLRVQPGSTAANGADGSRSDVSLPDEDPVWTKPVETLMETPLEQGADSNDAKGPASTPDDPPGLDVDPNIVPPDDTKGGDSPKDPRDEA